MANLKSDHISIFPTPNRVATYQREARLITESNLINIVNRLVDKDSFVISYIAAQNKITFNIHGYWIEADLTQSGLLTGESLYARIRIDTPVGSAFTELQGDDTNGIYSGVEFLNSYSGTDADGYYSLKLLENIDGTWQVPEDSWVKFTTNATTRSVTIDDGDLDLD